MIQTRSRASPSRVAGRVASSNNLANNGIQTIVLKNVLLKEEQMLSRIAKNRTKVDSGELRKAPDSSPGASHHESGLLAFISYLDSSWRTHGKRRVETALY